MRLTDKLTASRGKYGGRYGRPDRGKTGENWGRVFCHRRSNVLGRGRL